ncbi:hypothetical protein BB560_002886 [Smittium megazygosporum]|uniref:Exportin-T n=1 Tax=Smittium megazygosporum TaxID=133381 RepID=A0A2T9ZDK3_9FUNG|nr:hypothetical protein BB560_002886 [Smittium megazygosporum]
MEQLEEAVKLALDPTVPSQATEYCEKLRDSSDGWQVCLALFVQKKERELLSMTGIPFESAIDPTANSNSADALASNYAAMNLCLTDFVLKFSLAIDEQIVNPTIIRNRKMLELCTNVKDAMREESVFLLVNWWYNIIIFSKLDPNITAQAIYLISVYISWIEKTLIVNDKFLSSIFAYSNHPSLKSSVIVCIAAIIKKGMPNPEKIEILTYFNLPSMISQLQMNDPEYTEEVSKLLNTSGMELTAIMIESDKSSLEYIKSQQLLESMLPILLSFLENLNYRISSSVFPLITDILALYKKSVKKGDALSPNQSRFLYELLQVSVKKSKYSESFELPESIDLNSDPFDISFDEDEEEATFAECRRQFRLFLDSISVLIPLEFNQYVLSAIKETFNFIQANSLASIPNSYSNKSNTPFNWTQAELALYLTHLFIVQQSSKGFFSYFVGKDISKNSLAKTLEFNPSNPLKPQNQPNLTEFDEIALLMFRSGIVNFSRPLISLLYFDICTRLNQMFVYYPDIFQIVLESFLGVNGIHSNHKYSKARTWFLFLRFVKLLPQEIISPFAVETINSVAPLLEIQPETRSNRYSQSSYVNGFGIFEFQLYLFEVCGVIISSQLIPDNARALHFGKILNPIFSTLQTMLNVSPASLNSQSIELVQTHHYLVAIGAISRGFPDSKVLLPTTATSFRPTPLSSISIEAFTKAAEMDILILEKFSSFSIIREGVRVSFSRILLTLGCDALGHFPRFISSLISFCQVDELADLLGFLGQTMFKFKVHVSQPVNDLLLPVIDKVYTALKNSSVSGTDEALMIQNLEKAYLSWIVSFFSSDLDAVFMSEGSSNTLTQKLAFGVIHKSIIGWLVDKSGEYSLANISLMSIGSQMQPSSNKADSDNLKKTQQGVKPSSLPSDKDINKIVKERTLRQVTAESLGVPFNSVQASAFRDRFLLFVQQEILPVCFQVPCSGQFDFADAISSQILGEICGILRGFALVGQANGDHLLIPKSRIGPIIKPQKDESAPVNIDAEIISRNKAASFLCYEFLPKLGCNEFNSLNFVKALLSLGSKDFKRFFQQFITQPS